MTSELEIVSLGLVLRPRYVKHTLAIHGALTFTLKALTFTLIVVSFGQFTTEKPGWDIWERSITEGLHSYSHFRFSSFFCEPCISFRIPHFPSQICTQRFAGLDNNCLAKKQSQVQNGNRKKIVRLSTIFPYDCHCDVCDSLEDCKSHFATFTSESCSWIIKNCAMHKKSHMPK